MLGLIITLVSQNNHSICVKVFRKCWVILNNYVLMVSHSHMIEVKVHVYSFAVIIWFIVYIRKLLYTNCIYSNHLYIMLHFDIIYSHGYAYIAYRIHSYLKYSQECTYMRYTALEECQETNNMAWSTIWHLSQDLLSAVLL